MTLPTSKMNQPGISGPANLPLNNGVGMEKG